MNNNVINISVIIPMYNAQQTIIRAIDSVLKQTYKGNFEVIVVNDGSTDNSLEIVNQYIVENDLNDITVIDKPNGGVSSARNAGLLVAKGDWIALLDSDDEWLPEKTEVQMSIMEQYDNIDFLGCNSLGYQTRILWRLKDKLSPIKLWELMIKWHPQTPTIIFKKSIIEDVGIYNEEMRYGEDVEFLLRICKARECWFIPDQLVICGGGKFPFGDSGLSANLQAMQEGMDNTLSMAYEKRWINFMQYYLFSIYSKLKYCRRIFIVWRRRNLY
ncbi:putative glycosyltransferase EpsJ [termite gut metagenome]|uniref:Putative glycosyltransferase EpsJ n=1 Tax=termite gut metagenome TaxID=433724 RepID=A0A5J4T4F2_9ZZZZ